MNILKIVSIIFLCSFSMMQNMHGMEARKTQLIAQFNQLKTDLQNDKSMPSVTRIRDEAFRIANQAKGVDVLLVRHAQSLACSAATILNKAHLQNDMPLDSARRRRMAQTDATVAQEWTRLDQEMPDFSRVNLHPAN